MRTKRILLIVHQLEHLLTLKQALERNGGFLVTATTLASEAQDELPRLPYDLILIDFSIPDISGEAMIRLARQHHPHIAILVAPDRPVMRGLQTPYHLQGVIDLPIMARRFIALVKVILSEQEQALAQRPTDPPNLPDLLSGDSTALAPEPLSPEEQAEAQRREEQSTRLFEQLAALEPPMPPFEESVTVRDVLVGLSTSSTQSTRIVVIDTPDDEETTPTPSSITPPSDASRRSLANHILQEALETASVPTPPQGFSLAKFIQRVQERLDEGKAIIQPLPSWVEDSGRFVREPEFLQGDLPPIEEGPPSTYTASQTYANQSEQTPVGPAADLTRQPTDRIDPIRRSIPAPTGPVPNQQAQEASPTVPETAAEAEQAAHAEALPALADDLSLAEAQEQPTRQDALLAAALAEALAAEQLPPPSAPPPPAPEAELIEPPAPQADITREGYAADLIGRVVLALTDLALETVVEACVLVRDGQIVAHSGQLPLAMLAEIEPLIIQPLEADASARMDYVELAGGRLYMLYAIRTVADFVLGLLFAGQQTVSSIRHHGRLLAEVLDNVPAPEALWRTLQAVSDVKPDAGAAAGIAAEFEGVAVVAAEPEVIPASSAIMLPAEDAAGPDAEAPKVTTAPLSLVWLLNSQEEPLNDAEMEALLHGFERALQRSGWHIRELDVYQDVISLYADVPQGAPPPARLREVMGIATRLVQQANPRRNREALWDSSYLILTPGRALPLEELQEFVAFARD